MSSEEFRFVIFTGDIHFLNRKTCDFCDEDFPDVKALNEHLIQCGNKTELCPRCRKYIRRVEFVNHYENNCANLEDRPSIEKSKPTSQSSGSLIDTIPCEFCEQSCPFNEYDQHSRACSGNRKQIEEKPSPRLTSNSNQNRDILPWYVNQHNDDQDAVYSPCQFCKQSIESSQLNNHLTKCNRRPQQAPTTRRLVEENNNERLHCMYCNKRHKKVNDRYIHERTCSQKSSNHS